MYEIKYKYLPDNDGYEVSGYVGEPIEIFINEMHQEKKIISIGKEAFADCKSLKRIILPDSVKIIKCAAFENCASLQMIDLSSNMERIEWRAFYNCTSLSFIDFPDSLVEVCENAFANCTSLTSICISKNISNFDIFAIEGCNLIERIDVSSDNLHYSSKDGILYNKSGNILIKCPEEKTGIICIPEGVDFIYEDAFIGCSKIICVLIPHSIKSINYKTFSCCKHLEKITIPGHLNGELGKPFKGFNELTDLSFTLQTKLIDRTAFLCFSECASLKNIFIHEGIIDIDLSSIGTFPQFSKFEVADNNGVFASRDGVLYSKDLSRLLCCPASTNDIFVIPDGTKIIDAFAFQNCKKKEKIIVPDSIEKIYFSAFDGTNIRYGLDVNHNNRIYTSKNGALYSKNGDVLFWWPHDENRIVIPNGVKMLFDEIFIGRHHVKEVVLPTSIECIRMHTFSKNTILKTIIYEGTMDMFNKINSFEIWENSSVSKVVCSDGILPRAVLKKMFVSHIDLTKYKNKESSKNRLTITIKL